MPASTDRAHWLSVANGLRLQALRVRRDARRDSLGAFDRGMACGLRIGANAIAGELDEPIYLECEHRCRCRNSGPECTACELLWLAHDPPALLALADDRCACEHERQCDACAIAAVIRHESRSEVQP